MPQTLSSDTPDKGRLRIHVDSALTRSPVENARIRIFDTGQPEKALEEIGTDTNGNSETVELPAPPIEYSMEPSENQPYSEYTFQIQADGFEPLSISGAELFSGSLALQDVRLSPLEASGDFQNYTIPPHTLFGNYPPKIAEAEIKPVNASGEIVLSRVVVPEYIVVHDGSPRDSTAQDYYIRYSDYIKNVASSEIYATWPRAAIVANVLAIMSFTLNRCIPNGIEIRAILSPSLPLPLSTTNGSPTGTFLRVSPRWWMKSLQVISPGPMCASPFLTQYCDGQRSAAPTGSPSGVPNIWGSELYTC